MKQHEHAVARRLLGWLVLVLVAALPAELPAAACPVPEASAETMVAAPESTNRRLRD